MSVTKATAGGEPRPSDDRRAAAYVVDLVIFVPILWAIFAVQVWLGIIRPELSGWDLDPTALIVDLPHLIVPAVYFIGCWTRSGRTIGMRLCGIRVVRDDGLGLLTVRAALKRWLALQGVVLIVFLLIDRSGDLWFWVEIPKMAWLGFLYWSIHRDPLGRGFHDRVSGSRVIRDTGVS
ncbi:MAG: RDD family protein [Chloroflexi bacterium]|nr:RDD family protein [Chloroflexota bacterium]